MWLSLSDLGQPNKFYEETKKLCIAVIQKWNIRNIGLHIESFCTTVYSVWLFILYFCLFMLNWLKWLQTALTRKKFCWRHDFKCPFLPQDKWSCTWAFYHHIYGIEWLIGFLVLFCLSSNVIMALVVRQLELLNRWFIELATKICYIY